MALKSDNEKKSSNYHWEILSFFYLFGGSVWERGYLG